MKFKFKEVYGISEKNGTVKCELRMTNNMSAQWIVDALRLIQREVCPMYYNKSLPKAVYVPERFVGYAKLADGDTWNTSVGKKIAREKAYAKFKEWKDKYITYIKNTCLTINIMSDSDK